MVDPYPDLIRDVWADNLEAEIDKAPPSSVAMRLAGRAHGRTYDQRCPPASPPRPTVACLVDDYPYVSMDTEFPGAAPPALPPQPQPPPLPRKRSGTCPAPRPACAHARARTTLACPGVIVQPVVPQQGNYKNVLWKMIQSNVNLLKIIQLGITLSDFEGNTPTPTATWQFHFHFDLNNDHYAPESIDLLQGSGLDFEQHSKKGIDPRVFSEVLTTSGMVLRPSVYWVSFHGGYDFAYLLKLLTGDRLPEEEKDFLFQLEKWFPNLCDIKYILKSTSYHKPQVGLNDLASDLGASRFGPQHQAGSDSLLTKRVFVALINTYLPKFDFPEYAGILYGLGKDHVSGIHIVNVSLIVRVHSGNKDQCDLNLTLLASNSSHASWEGNVVPAVMLSGYLVLTPVWTPCLGLLAAVLLLSCVPLHKTRSSLMFLYSFLSGGVFCCTAYCCCIGAFTTIVLGVGLLGGGLDVDCLSEDCDKGQGVDAITLPASAFASAASAAAPLQPIHIQYAVQRAAAQVAKVGSPTAKTVPAGSFERSPTKPRAALTWADISGKSERSRKEVICDVCWDPCPERSRPQAKWAASLWSLRQTIWARTALKVGLAVAQPVIDFQFYFHIRSYVSDGQFALPKAFVESPVPAILGRPGLEPPDAVMVPLSLVLLISSIVLHHLPSFGANIMFQWENYCDIDYLSLAALLVTTVSLTRLLQMRSPSSLVEDPGVKVDQYMVGPNGQVQWQPATVIQ
eukprot:gene6713-1201_t